MNPITPPTESEPLQPFIFSFERLSDEQLTGISHWSLDIETLSTRSNAAVIAIAVIPFDPGRRTIYVHGDNCFFATINPESYDDFEPGEFHISHDTMVWWQSSPVMKELYKELTEHGSQPATAVQEELSHFINWVGLDDKDKKSVVWANGASFDFPIVDNFLGLAQATTYNHVAYRKLRCARTIWEEVKAQTFASQWIEDVYMSSMESFSKSCLDDSPMLRPHHPIYDAVSNAVKICIAKYATKYVSRNEFVWRLLQGV